MDYFVNNKKAKLKKLEEQILEDAKDFDSLIILCLGKYDATLSPYLTFASIVGTILKMNQMPVYGDEENPILIDKKVSKVSREIIKVSPHPFVLVVMNSVSEEKTNISNLYYENAPFENKEVLVGDATLKLCGSFGKTKEDYDANSLSKEIIDETATSIAFSLMKVINLKQGMINLNTDELSLKLEKETE